MEMEQTLQQNMMKIQDADLSRKRPESQDNNEVDNDDRSKKFKHQDDVIDEESAAYILMNWRNSANNSTSNQFKLSHQTNGEVHQIPEKKKKKTPHEGVPHKKTSKFYGVSITSGGNKWHAGIFINGKTVHIGNYATEIEAAEAYDIVAKELSNKKINFGTNLRQQRHKVDGCSYAEVEVKAAMEAVRILREKKKTEKRTATLEKSTNKTLFISPFGGGFPTSPSSLYMVPGSPLTSIRDGRPQVLHGEEKRLFEQTSTPRSPIVDSSIRSNTPTDHRPPVPSQAPSDGAGLAVVESKDNTPSNTHAETVFSGLATS